MYRPEVFREDRLEVQHALIAQHPLGLLVASGPDGLTANHLPFVLRKRGNDAGVLRTHLARPNPDLDLFATQPECMVVFQGPSGYVSPSWYPSKAQHGKVVPTWNYAVVHAWGRPKVVDDASWLHAHIEALTLQQEAHRPDSWAVGDAPDQFVGALVRGIVGLEISISRLEGKWKVSQNRSPEDQQGVRQGLQAEGNAALAELVGIE